MIQALDLEVTEIRRKGRASRLDVRNGEQVGQAGSKWLYRFIISDTPSVRDDTLIRIEVASRKVQGSVVSFRDGALIVALEEDLGPAIPQARLIWDASFLVEELKKRLEEVRGGATYFSHDAAERTLGLARPRVADANPHHSVLADGVLNGEQIAAICRALGSDTTFVWGPAGHGQDENASLTSLEAHYREGRSVLLVSNTNIAVDTALEQVAERLSSEPGFDEGLVAPEGHGCQGGTKGEVRRAGNRRGDREASRGRHFRRNRNTCSRRWNLSSQRRNSSTPPATHASSIPRLCRASGVTRNRYERQRQGH